VKKVSFFRKVRALIQKDGRRSRQNIPATLLLVALLCLGCGFLFLSVVTDAQTAEEILPVGIVAKDGSFVSRLAIQMVTSNQEVEEMFRVNRYDTEEEAYEAVHNGTDVGAIIFQKGYFEKILQGEDSAVSVIVSRAAEVHVRQLRDFAGTGEILIKVGEYGVNSAWEPLLNHYQDRDKAVIRYNKLSLQFASEVMVLIGGTVDMQQTPYSVNSVSLVGHYVLLYCSLLLSLLDIIFFEFVRWDCSRTLLSRLRTMGVRAEHILTAKLPRILLIKGILLAAVLIVAGRFLPLTWNFVSVAGIMAFLLLQSVLTVCLCTLLQASDVGPAILCAIHFAGLFLCGGLVPYDMMPLAVTRTGSFAPVGVEAALLAPVLGGSGSAMAFVLSLGYPALAVLLSLKKIGSLYVKGSDPV